MNRDTLAALAHARRAAHRQTAVARPKARATGRVVVNARPGAPTSTIALDRGRGITPDIRLSQPAESAASGYGAARGSAPAPPARTVVGVAGNLRLEAEVLRYAEVQAREALAHFPGVQSIDILLGTGAAGETTCRLEVSFVAAPSILVGHSGPAILHAIDTAVETAAHIVAAQARAGL